VTARSVWSIGAWTLLGIGSVMLLGSMFTTIRTNSAESVSAGPVTQVPLVRPASESLSQVVVARDLFRSSRRPAAVPYDPQRTLQPILDAPPKPPLALVGIVAGSAPTAVIEGFPGVDGPRVVHAGELVAGLLVQRIGRATVRIVGMDTVWLLSVREPWK
jgi:hypothetical protein